MLCNFFINLNSIFRNNEIDDIIVAYAVITDPQCFCGKQWIIIQEHEDGLLRILLCEYSLQRNVLCVLNL
jgi:hypothetical protein